MSTNPKRARRPSPTPTLDVRSLLLVACAALATAGGCSKDPIPQVDSHAAASSSGPNQEGDPTLPKELESASEQTQDAGAADAPWEGPRLVVTRASAAIYSEPKFDRKLKLGYARSGGRVPIKPEPVSQDECKGNWYQLPHGGYICGNVGTTDLGHVQVKFATKQPNLEEVLPYTYARNREHGTPLYRSVPSREQMLSYEPYLDGAQGAKKREAERNDDEAAEARKSAEREGDGGVATTSLSGDAGGADPLGKALAEAGVLLTESDAGDEPETPWWQQESPEERLHELKIDDLAEGSDDVLVKRMVKGFYVAIDRTFRWNNRTWYKTTKGLVAPADRFWQVAGFKFKGVELDGKQATLPVAWVYGGRKKTSTYEADADSGELKPAQTVKRFVAVWLTGKQQTIRKTDYWETKDGHWIKDAYIRVAHTTQPPADLGPKERWLDINVTEQTLVMFEGRRPVYATLVSTGKKSRIKEKDHRTPTGEWRIRGKHVTTTMDGDFNLISFKSEMADPTL